MKKIHLFLAFIFMATLCACSVPVSDNSEETQWSGAIPPLYCRWDHEGERRNFILPLAYFNDSCSQFYSLFGWNCAHDNYQFYYYLTPFIYTMKEYGIAKNSLLFFEYRNINTDSHPEAAPFDFQFWPLINYKTHTSINGMHFNEFSVGGELLALYVQQQTRFKNDFYTLNIDKTGYASLTTTHRTETLGDKAFNSERIWNAIPFYWSKKNEDLIFTSTQKPLKHVEKQMYIFPFTYLNTESGKTIIKNQESPQVVATDGYNLLVFPFFQYRRIQESYMTQSLFWLYIYTWDNTKQKSMNNILWFFNTTNDPNNSSFSFIGRFFEIQTGKEDAFYLCFFRLF